MKCSACLWRRPRRSTDGGQAFALYLDAVLVAVVALLAVIVLGDSMRQWYGYVVLKRPFTSSEVVVMARWRVGADGFRRTQRLHVTRRRLLLTPAG